MTDRLHLPPKHRRALEALLRAHLPDVEVWAYGSRVNGRSHDGSDLDLVLRGPDLKEIPAGQLGDFEEAARESNIPFLVEARDWARLPERFHREIEREHVVLTKKEESQVDEGWREHLLGELTDNFDSIRAPIKQAERRTGPYPYYGASGIIDFIDDHLFDGEYLLIAEDGENLRTRNTPIAFLASGKFWVNNHAHVVRGNQKADTRYLLYALTASDVSGYLTGSTMPKLTQGNLDRISLSMPPPPEQRAIAYVLGTLDDKIELNRRMNETLEAIVRALFKSWFVDFDPVGAKMEGRDTCLPRHIADLFPDRMEESETGEIPQGWKQEPVRSFADVVYGAPFASSEFNNDRLGVPLIRIRDLATHEPSVWTRQVHKKGQLINPGDIVVGMDGEFRLHVWKGPIAWMNQRVCHFEPKSGVPTVFLSEALKTPLAFFERGKVGTTVIHLGKSDIDTFRLLQPGQGPLKAFASIAQPLLDRTVANALESRSLAHTRDLLLPRLISGKIHLPEAELAMEEAT